MFVLFFFWPFCGEIAQVSPISFVPLLYFSSNQARKNHDLVVPAFVLIL